MTIAAFVVAAIGFFVGAFNAERRHDEVGWWVVLAALCLVAMVVLVVP